MATPPYAKVLVSVNGAAAVSGGLTVTAGQTIQLSGESTVGWRSQRWEITDAPPGFTLPSGWVAAGDGTFYSLAVAPPAFTMPTLSSTTWGKYAIRLRVNGNPLLVRPDGTRNPAYKTNLTDESTMLSMLSSAGLEGIALGETTQFDAVKGWLGGVQRNFRNLPTVGSGSGIPNDAVAIYSAVADGATDNTSPFGTANTALGSTRRMYLKEGGTYLVNNNLTITCPIEFAPSALISVGAGKTLTITGQVHADDYQKIFAGLGKVVLTANANVSVCWWGADWTNTNDSADAIQNCVNSCLAVTRVLNPTATTPVSVPFPPVAWMPAGLYFISRTIVIAGTSLRYKGSGPLASAFTTRGGQYPTLFCTRDIGGLPRVANLTGSATGNAYNLDFTRSDPVPGSPGEFYAGSPDVNYLIPSHETTLLSGSAIAALTKICNRFVYRIGTSPSETKAITNNGGIRTDGGDTAHALSGWNIYLTAAGKLHIDFNPSAGGALIADSDIVLSTGTKYFVEFNWDSTTGRVNFHVAPFNGDGSLGTVNTKSVTGPTGHILADIYSMTVIGASQSTFPETGKGTPAFGQISEWELRDDTGHGNTVTGRTLGNFAFDSHTISGTHFEVAGPNGELVVFYDRNGNKTFVPIRLGDTEVGNRYGGGIHCTDFGTDTGVYAQLCTNSVWDNIWTLGGTYGVVMNNNCYDSTVSRCRVHTTSLMGIAAINGGNITVDSCEIATSGFATVSYGSSVVWIRNYAQSPYVGNLVNGGATTATVNFVSHASTDEAYQVHEATMLIGGAAVVSALNSVFEAVNSHGNTFMGVYSPTVTYAAGQAVRARADDTEVYVAQATVTGVAPTDTTKWKVITNDLFRLTYPTARLTLLDCNLNDTDNLGCLFRFAMQGAEQDGAVRVVERPRSAIQGNPNFKAPLTNAKNPRAVRDGDQGKEAGVKGLGNGKTAANNLWGLATIYGGTTKTTVTFDTPEPDTNYLIVQPAHGVHAGTPAAGSIAGPFWSAKTINGFDLNIPVDPGSGNSVDEAWMIGRYARLKPPVVTSLSPTHALPTATTTVTATGTDFADGVGAEINGTFVAGTFVSSTSFTFTAPTSAATGDVVVIAKNPDGRKSNFVAFHYDGVPIISSTSPTTLTTAGGTIAVTGQAFLAGMTALYNGASAAVSSITATTANVAIPATTPQGTYNLVLTTTAGAGPAYAFPVTDPVGDGTAYGEAGAYQWYKSDIGVTSSAGVVSAVIDQTGAGRNASAGSTGATLTTTGAGINGKSVFAGSKTASRSLNAPALTGLTAAHIFMIIKPVVDGTAQSMWQAGSDSQLDYWPYLSGTGFTGSGTNTRRTMTSGAGATVTSAAQLVEIVSTGSKYEVRVNGSVVYTTASNTVAWRSAGVILLGGSANPSTGGAAAYTDGLMGEWLVFDHEVTGSGLTNVKAGLTTRWGVP
jgi:hypothetical protein